MIHSFEGRAPQLHESVWVASTAFVVGDVTIGEHSSVWPSAVIRADFSTIAIGTNTVVEDCCVVHTGEPMTIGDNTTIGHGVVVHCRAIGDNCLIGNNSTLLDGAEIGSFSIVAAGALVPPRAQVPEGSFVRGLPATWEPLDERRLEGLRARSGTDRGYADLARRYKAEGL